MRKVLAQTKLYIVMLLTGLMLVAWVLVLGSRPMANDKTPIRVVIAMGTPASKVAEILSEKGLIRSPFVFTLTSRVSGSSDKLKPGVYEFNRSMSVPEMIDRLVVGESLECWITIPEGLNASQIADLLAQKQLVAGKSFIYMAIDQGISFPAYPFIGENNLEGYLFPDTYLITRGTDSEKIIVKMLGTFENKVVSPLRPQLEAVIKQRFGLGEESFSVGLRRILTLASLVEREAKTDKDRRLIAAVLWNRIAKNMRLEVDATVTYTPGVSRSNKDKVYYKDLQNDSPYNTYRHFGLPPTPICNPGLASIKAVLDPAPVDYLFYVAKPDGTHVFNKDYNAHLAAKKAIEDGKH